MAPKPKKDIDSKSNKEDTIQVEGVIAKVLPNGYFRVQVNGGSEVLAYASGKMQKNFIKIVLGDKVKVVVSPYDLTRGRIVFRG